MEALGPEARSNFSEGLMAFSEGLGGTSEPTKFQIWLFPKKKLFVGSHEAKIARFGLF